MVSLEQVLRWAPGSHWRLEQTLPAALKPWLEGRHPLLESCLNSEWVMRSAALGPEHAELHFSGGNATELAIRLRYAADGSLEGELDMTLEGTAHSLRRGELAVMLGGKHEAYLCDRKNGDTRMLLRLEYDPGEPGAARCSGYTEAVRERVPPYLHGLLPQEVSLCAVLALAPP